MTSTPQTYATHSQYLPLYHFFASPLALVFFVWTVIRLIKQPNADTVYMLVGALALIGVVAVSRVSPLKAQDRLIRLEERLRYARLLPADLVQRAEAVFRPRHYIALRFASDAELPALIEQVLANPEIKAKALKQQIKVWRPDTFRV